MFVGIVLKNSIDAMKVEDMPGWLQTLRNINPRVAEEAEKDLDRLKNAATPTSYMKCDSCECHPSVLYSTPDGVFCQHCYNSKSKY